MKSVDLRPKEGAMDHWSGETISWLRFYASSIPGWLSITDPDGFQGMRLDRKQVLELRNALNEWLKENPSPDPLPGAIEGFDCPDKSNHGKPFRYCGIQGCGWHDGMPA